MRAVRAPWYLRNRIRVPQDPGCETLQMHTAPTVVRNWTRVHTDAAVAQKPRLELTDESALLIWIKDLTTT